MNKSTWIQTACLGALLPVLCASGANVPALIEFNGTLAWSGTNAPVAGVHPFTIRLYDQWTDGTLLWEEQANVEVDASGRYGVQLGAGTQGATTNTLSEALGLAGSTAFLELEIIMNGQTRLFAPRQQLASAPFALMAGNARQATRGLDVAGMLIVAGDTQVDRVTAGTVEGSEVVVTKQITLLSGPLSADVLTSLDANEPVVFSTGVSATKETRVTGNLQIFSMKKPKLTVDNPYAPDKYRADTDCWLYMVVSSGHEDFPIKVVVGTNTYQIPMDKYAVYPVPIPKGTFFSVRGLFDTFIPMTTDPNTDEVFGGNIMEKTFFLSLGVAP